MADQIPTLNLGTRTRPRVPPPSYPDASEALAHLTPARQEAAVDVLLVNPPSPDGGIWIRSQHRVGRKSRENMVWPQVSLAQLAAILHPDYRVGIIDAIAERLTWPAFRERLQASRPRYYVTQVSACTLENDMYGVFLAKATGAVTIAFGTHVTPMARETMRPYPALDIVLRGEPEATLRELIDHRERQVPSSPAIAALLASTGTTPQAADDRADLGHIAGVVWRKDGAITVNRDRLFIPNLDDLPLPLHDWLPLERYRVPMMKTPYSFVVTSRGCTAGCTFCIKHVSYQASLRLRSPAHVVSELQMLKRLGIGYVHLYADLFTLSREQVVGIAEAMIAADLGMQWTCNSRVDYVDDELLALMARAGCWMIAWGLESASRDVLKRARKGADPDKAQRALAAARRAGIKNWGYFIIGLPGETEATIRETIRFSKSLPLDIALFHVAAPYPGTPFFFEVVKNGWFRPGTRWEDVDMDRSTVVDYPHLSAERLQYWQKRAFREWALRPGPILTFLKGFNSRAGIRSGLDIAWQHLRWIATRDLEQRV